MDYYPDAWVILKLPNGLYKILAGWHGGYLGADSWQVNSGITSYTESEGIVSFEGVSGSVYHCNLASERFTSLTRSIFNQFTEITTISYEEYKCLA